MDRNKKIIFEALLTISIIFEILFLILVSIGFIAGIKSNSVYIFGFYDVIISILILFDFVFFRYIKRNNLDSWKFIRENWFYIIAIVPLFFICFNIFQLFGFKIFITLIGIIRIYALLKVLQKTSKEVRKYPQKTKLDYATFILILVIIFGSLLFFIVETGVNSEVPNYESAIWYSFVSMATVGYGDIVPITFAGRIIGSILILTGMAYVSLVTATLAYSFIDLYRKERSKAENKIDKLLVKIEDLDNKIDEIKNKKE